MEEREKVRIENVELLCPEYSCPGWAGPGVIVVRMKVDQIMTNRNYILPLKTMITAIAKTNKD